MHLILYVLPLILTPEVVEKKKAASQRVLAQPFSFFAREFEISGLDEIDQRVVEEPLIHDGDLRRLGRDCEVGTGPVPHADNEVIVGLGIVYPPRLVSRAS